MYAALMTSNTNISMVEYLMAGMWILLKHPANRKVLGEAFQVGPAGAVGVKMMLKRVLKMLLMSPLWSHKRVASPVQGSSAACHGHV